jgi:hypothetical protein
LSNADKTLIPFKPAGVPADVLFENDNATAETSGKWVTVMADSPGVSSGRLEWELKVRWCCGPANTFCAALRPGFVFL